MFHIKNKLLGTNRRRRIMSSRVCRYTLVGDSSATRRRLVGDRFSASRNGLRPLTNQEPQHSHGTACKKQKIMQFEWNVEREEKLIDWW